jgi:hypothetical protein
MRHIAAACLLFLTTPSRAELRTSKEGQVSVDVPSTWEVSKGGKNVMLARSPDEAARLVFWVVEPNAIDAAIGELGKRLGNVGHFKWERAEDANLNGLTGRQRVGTAKIGGRPGFALLATVGLTPTKKAVLIFGVIEQDKLAEHKAELRNIFQSLKPVTR